jgi:hypothetical protein
VPVDRLGHEDDVDVADVVQLVPPTLAHRDHGEPAAVGGFADLGAGDRECGVQGPAGEVGQLRRGVVHPEVVGQVAGGEPEQHPAVLHPECVQRVGPGQRRDRLRLRRIGTHRVKQSLLDRERGRPGGPQGGIGELVPLLGVPTQVFAECLAGSEDGEQPHRGALVVGHFLQQLLPVLSGLGQRHQRAQRQVGIGTATQQRRERLGDLAELVEQPPRLLGVREAEPGQAPQVGLADI